MRTLGIPEQVTMFLHMNLLTSVSRILAIHNPAKSASYFASLLDARKPFLNDFSTQIPSSEISTMPTPAPQQLEDPSTYVCHIEIIFYCAKEPPLICTTSLEIFGVNSAMKSAKPIL